MGMFGDSWATGQARSLANTAGTEGATLFGEGQGIQAQLLPFLRGELTASHAFSPTQLNEMLTAASAGGGGAASSLGGEAELYGARTGNTAAVPALLDKIARAKTQGLAKASEGIAAEDVNMTERNRQAGAAGLANLYGQDTGEALKAMGLQNEAINSEVKAANTGGWFRNLTDTLSSLSGSALKAAEI